MSELSLWTNGADTYVAASADEAASLYQKHVGEPWEGKWTEEKKPDPLTIQMDDGRGKVTKPIAEWIAATGKGFLCSTEW